MFDAFLQALQKSFKLPRNIYIYFNLFDGSHLRLDTWHFATWIIKAFSLNCKPTEYSKFNWILHKENKISELSNNTKNIL